MGKKIDMIGKIFGDYKVISFDDTKGKYQYYWNCECIHCGHLTTIQGSAMRAGKCIKCSECNKTYNIPEQIKGYAEDLTGKVFGNFTVDSFAFVKHSHSHWNCHCFCGAKYIKSIAFLNKADGKICDECKKRIKEENIAALKELKKNNKNKQVYQGKKKNSYQFVDDYVIINDDIIIDANDFELVDSYDRYIRINSSGYALFDYYNDEIFLSRLIVGLPPTFTEEDGRIAEHIDGNRRNNRRSNLRVCQKKYNPINVGIYSNNTTGHKGVSWNKKLQKYQVSIQKDKINHYLGVYENIDDAIAVREKAESELFGEYNRTKENLYNTNGNVNYIQILNDCEVQYG